MYFNVNLKINSVNKFDVIWMYELEQLPQTLKIGYFTSNKSWLLLWMRLQAASSVLQCVCVCVCVRTCAHMRECMWARALNTVTSWIIKGIPYSAGAHRKTIYPSHPCNCVKAMWLSSEQWNLGGNDEPHFQIRFVKSFHSQSFTPFPHQKMK